MKESKLVLGMVFFLLIFVIGIYAFRYFTAEIRGKVDMETSVASGLSQEFSYNYFFNACAAIQGYERTLSAQRKAFDQVTEKEDKTRIMTNIAAVEAERGRAIARYNADAAKIKTLARFKDADLPNRLNEEANKTVCNF